MPTINRFEDIEAWKKARQLSKLVYEASSQGAFGRDYALRDQIRRAAISVLSNIAEGYERGGDKEFRQFLSLAKGSAGEVQAQLYVALDVGFVSPRQFEQIYDAASETSRLIGGFIRYLGASSLGGSKYKQRSSRPETRDSGLET